MHIVDTKEAGSASAIYLIGHGPLREPRLVEMQLFRIQRYIRLLPMKERRDIPLPADEVFVDINYPRKTVIEARDGFPALKQLVAAIRSKRISHVFVDIVPPNGPQLGVEWNPDALSKSGAIVINVVDDEHRLLHPVLERYGASPQELLIWSGAADSEDMVTFFPVLAGRIMQRLVFDQEEREIPYALSRKIEQLCDESPYGGGNFPTISSITENRLVRRKWEQSEKIKSRRSQEEVLLRLSPRSDEKAVLLDEVLFDKPRTNEQWIWAEERLKNLGFEKKVEDRRMSFIRRVGNHLVYADPRSEGRIHFKIYEMSKNGKAVQSASTFMLPDKWKNNLEEKLLKQIGDQRVRSPGNDKD
ncbi:hypothetical protein [Stigmatella aurantiaca]|uniref:Uncharacterized protein n=1 Tax=Stigmatella aurantiaca (strain DW4/3-1) TaxID=378806 RepID=Q090X3_STIAD|nr:hypothetical protein [Stigmatella aurantiaca]ADO71712.1 uncharacterized protein STAUR_3924 [Stigmatella aurantiaca DW4/3-1]EAU66283.1 hypothetical protein STIAU_2563 [Stigmatella aurantiaca DW4/3-1]